MANRQKLAFMGTESSAGVFEEAMGTDCLVILDGRWGWQKIYEAVQKANKSLAGVGKKYTHYRVGRFTHGGNVDWSTGVFEIR